MLFSGEFNKRSYRCIRQKKLSVSFTNRGICVIQSEALRLSQTIASSKMSHGERSSRERKLTKLITIVGEKRFLMVFARLRMSLSANVANGPQSSFATLVHILEYFVQAWGIFHQLERKPKSATAQ